jgi:aspartyl protease family protein
MHRALLLPALMLGASVAAAQGVALSGTMGTRALLIIDGQPQMVAPGQSARGVKLLEVQGEQARIERDGQIFVLRVGAAPVSVGAPPRPQGSEIVVPMGQGGHFFAAGAINGRAVRFMVDTGATLVAMSRSEADRIGLDYRNADSGTVNTAGGPVQAFRINLVSVRVGEVELNNVDAVVTASAMPYVLLGNSFLSRFQMRRDNDIMRLELRR